MRRSGRVRGYAERCLCDKLCSSASQRRSGRQSCGERRHHWLRLTTRRDEGRCGPERNGTATEWDVAGVRSGERLAMCNPAVRRRRFVRWWRWRRLSRRRLSRPRRRGGCRLARHLHRWVAHANRLVAIAANLLREWLLLLLVVLLLLVLVLVLLDILF